MGGPTDLSTVVLIQGDQYYTQSTAILRTVAVRGPNPKPSQPLSIPPYLPGRSPPHSPSRRPTRGTPKPKPHTTSTPHSFGSMPPHSLCVCVSASMDRALSFAAQRGLDRRIERPGSPRLCTRGLCTKGEAEGLGPTNRSKKPKKKSPGPPLLLAWLRVLMPSFPECTSQGLGEVGGRGTIHHFICLRPH